MDGFSDGSETNGWFRRRLGFRAATVLVVAGVLLAACTPQASSGCASLFDATRPSLPYADKNGYFRVVVPDDWTAYEYDDPRSKVAFLSPTGDAVVTFIAAAAPDGLTSSNVVQVMHEDLVSISQATPQISMELTPGEFSGFSAAFLEQRGPGLAQDLTLFVASGIFFNIGVCAPSEDALAVHGQEVALMLDSLVVVGSASAADSKDHQIARYLTLAHGLTAAGQFEDAERYVIEGHGVLPRRRGSRGGP